MKKSKATVVEGATVPLRRNDDGIYITKHCAEGTFGDAKLNVSNMPDGSVVVMVQEGDRREQYIVRLDDILHKVVEVWNANTAENQ